MKRRKRSQSGMTLVELLISLTLLAVILSALMPLMIAAMAENTRNRNDSASTMLSQMVLESIIEQPATASPVLQLTDCAGNVRNINTAAGGAALNAGGSAIDWTVAMAPNGGYSMIWIACGAGTNGAGGVSIANQTGVPYEVRWNVQQATAFTKVVTVSARPLQAASTNITVAWQPISLRGIGGS